MRGFSFLITWLVFGIPSSAIAVGIGCFLHLSAITIAVLVVAIEAIPCPHRQGACSLPRGRQADGRRYSQAEATEAPRLSRG